VCLQGGQAGTHGPLVEVLALLGVGIMIERPILFNGEMVRAVLNGSKTQTRRVAKLSDRGHLVLERNRHHTVCARMTNDGPEWTPAGSGPSEPLPQSHIDAACPYGAPGDRLWVRETFRVSRAYDCLPPKRVKASIYHYAADGRPSQQGYGFRWGKVRQSIFMPRWASRISLDVLTIRVERLQAITADGARAEGHPVDPARSRDQEVHDDASLDWFMDLWDDINGKKPGRAWADNPWVWVVGFKRCGQ